MVWMKSEASSIAWCVPVSSHAMPLPMTSTSNCLRFRYSLFTSVISSSPRAEGRRHLAISTT